MTNEEILALPSRPFAKSQDFYLNSSQSGQGPYNPEAIGGSYSINWWDVFEDAETGKQFRVYCSDGVYGGRGPYKDGDEPKERWIKKIHRLRYWERVKAVTELCPREDGWVFQVIDWTRLAPWDQKRAKEWADPNGQITWSGEVE